MSLGIVGAFSWIGRLFLHQATDAASTVLQDEIHKATTEIQGTIAPYLQGIPPEQYQQILTNVTEIAKKAAVAYAEAYADSYLKKIPAPPALSTPPAA